MDTELEFSKKDHQQLLDAYISDDRCYMFQNRDAELSEIFQAYTNLSTALADEYLEYVIDFFMSSASADEYPEKILTVKSWLKNKLELIEIYLNDFEDHKISDIRFN